MHEFFRNLANFCPALTPGLGFIGGFVICELNKTLMRIQQKGLGPQLVFLILKQTKNLERVSSTMIENETAEWKKQIYRASRS